MKSPGPSQTFEVVGDANEHGYREPMPKKCAWEDFAGNPGYGIEQEESESPMQHNPGMEMTMHEFKHGQLHSGSKSGPVVKNRKQAIAIGMSEMRHNDDSHPGFEAVASSIAAKEGYSKERASAILASRTRAASASAKKANPRLKRVKG